MRGKQKLYVGIIAMLLAAVWCVQSNAADRAPTKPLDDAHKTTGAKLADAGVKYLLTQKDAKGGWSMGQDANRPAITAMVLKVLVQHPDYDSKSPVVVEGFKALMTYRKADGGFYEPNMGLPNYTTSIAIMAMVAADDPKLRPDIDKAVKFLRTQQIRPGDKLPKGGTVKKGEGFDGGVSYGRHGRPDGSNNQMWIQAMSDAGVKADDPDLQRANAFMLRLQNRKESNDADYIQAGPNDGGYIYALGESKAGPWRNGRGLRSYGSLTYAGFKSMLHAGMGRKDPRVLSAFKWIQRYWRLDSNPNMPKLQSQQGLFYYYHVFSKALRAWGDVEIVDTKGVKHNWRHELIDALGKRASKDGSWTNKASERWNEGNPVLATCFATLALQETLKTK
ncbi:MAG: terpene cyclase/mutase family protein [Phycisphaerae bacterium]|jgi:squalene-hopene/tetraprenyl-beta-curcumene cyclase|nr:terpene cyclase/mutase family protein [Phycisphaerae bacterium]